MSRIGFLLLVLVLFIGFEWYSFAGLNLVFTGDFSFQLIYWITLVLVLLGFYKVMLDLRDVKGKVRSPSTNLLLGIGFAILVTKIVFVGFLLLQDGGRFVILIFNFIIFLIKDSPIEIPSRSYALTSVSAVLTTIPFVSMVYGVTFGKYKYKVENIKLQFSDLPKAFHGFKILQISDIHAGSFDSVEKVKKGIDLIKDQNADMIVFTGDLVNSMKEEINPYINVFAEMSAPFGMFSILGNHDYYGMYQVAQKDPIARKVYMDDFRKKHETIGFKLLTNDSIKINIGMESIRLIGVENWGAGPFPKKGDLNKALQGVDQNEFSILLSHDPTHWDHHVIKHPMRIQLTLSGHTHGMQFGIKIGKFQWSPVKYRYKRWMGIYKSAGQYLYVNRGFGFLAWPGRVGMSPEITVFNLESEI